MNSKMYAKPFHSFAEKVYARNRLTLQILEATATVKVCKFCKFGNLGKPSFDFRLARVVWYIQEGDIGESHVKAGVLR